MDLTDAIPRKKMNAKFFVIVVLISISILCTLVKLYFIKDSQSIGDYSKVSSILSLVSAICLLSGFFLALPFKWLPLLIQGIREFEVSASATGLVEKLRYRAVLFNNIAVVIFLVTIAVIVTGFFLLAHPLGNVDENTNRENVEVATRISSTLLVIFLVNVLFRVFKYVLRVAAFYHGRADGIEMHLLKSDEKLVDCMVAMSPDSYDISDLPEAGLLPQFGKG